MKQDMKEKNIDELGSWQYSVVRELIRDIENGEGNGWEYAGKSWSLQSLDGIIIVHKTYYGCLAKENRYRIYVRRFGPQGGENFIFGYRVIE